MTSLSTLSSLQIAELTGKEHRKVLRDIRVMLISLYGESRVERIIPENRRNRHKEFINENSDAISSKFLSISKMGQIGAIL